ncbi:MAG TPA: carboxymuconolactone decarboxylase family protein [Verrucomicrobiae bacterium]|nr:carboxymuconolactone decarboxylase family protein [Verrucomicrobiae bacterium]
MTARIAPLDPPYSADVQAAFDAVMRGAPPLALFRTLAHNPRVLSRMIAGGLLDRGSISMRQRELMILRTTALCGAEYEWGVHVAAFGVKSKWTPAELAASVRRPADDPAWSADERAIVKLADALHATHTVDDALWSELKNHFADDQLIELVMLAGLYHAVSFTLNTFRIPLEAGAPRFPA